MMVLDIARLFLFVRELPGNKGLRVEAIQKWGGGSAGDSWCAWFVTMVLDLRDQGKCPLARTGSCDVILQWARANKCIVTEPQPGDVYLVVRTENPNDAHHTGLVTTMLYDDNNVRKFGQISGNTSEDGTSDNGDRVAERAIKYRPANHVFVRVPAPA